MGVGSSSGGHRKRYIRATSTLTTSLLTQLQGRNLHKPGSVSRAVQWCHQSFRYIRAVCCSACHKEITQAAILFVLRLVWACTEYKHSCCSRYFLHNFPLLCCSLNILLNSSSVDFQSRRCCEDFQVTDNPKRSTQAKKAKFRQSNCNAKAALPLRRFVRTPGSPGSNWLKTVGRLAIFTCPGAISVPTVRGSRVPVTRRVRLEVLCASNSFKMPNIAPSPTTRTDQVNETAV